MPSRQILVVNKMIQMIMQVKSNRGNMLKGLTILSSMLTTPHKNQCNTHLRLLTNKGTHFHQMQCMAILRFMDMGTILQLNIHTTRLLTRTNIPMGPMIPTAIIIFLIHTVLLRDINVQIAIIRTTTIILANKLT
jgi:hypothetical protein